jgi:uncharacterized coiled-coil protein SlyX
MLRKVLTENYELDQTQVVQNIYTSLEEIRQKLESEITYKQTIIDGCGNEIKLLRSQIVVKEQAIQNLQDKVLENQRSIEGNRQLINKLLNDLERMQQDVEWYKRTYEHRSLFGHLNQALKNILSRRNRQ